MAHNEKSDGKIISQETTIGPKELIELLTVMVDDDVQQPVMIWGQPGIGKSEIVDSIAKKLNRPFIDIRLLLMDPTDLRGIPYKNDNDEVVWAKPSQFPDDLNDRSIIFIDEINAAPPSVQCAALQLVLNRRIGEYVLPKGVAIVAAGNRESDRTSVNRMPSALANRFVHFNLTVVFNDWKEWAFNNNIRPDILGFLASFEKYLNTFDPATNSKAYATPRTWTFVNKILNTSLSDHLKYKAISGTIGDGVCGEFRRFRKFTLNLPKPEEILTGTIKKLDENCRKEISLQHALSVSLTYKLKSFYDLYKQSKENQDNSGISEREWKKLAGNFALFISDDDNFDAEIATMTLATSIRTMNIPLTPKDIPELMDFFKKYKEFLNYN
jgi:hypothetical protein